MSASAHKAPRNGKEYSAEPVEICQISTFRLTASLVQKTVQVNVQGITHADSLIQPRPAGSCLNWVLGHLLWVYQGTLPLLGQKAVLTSEALDRYDRGKPPLTDATEAVEFSTLLSAWEEACIRIDAGLADLTTEMLDSPAASSPTGNPDETNRSLLTTVLFHQAYHAGQFGILRRIAGKPGAVK